MVAVGMMQTAVDQIVRVVAMRHGLMAAPRCMLVISAVCSCCAGRGIFAVYGNDVFVHMVAVHVMQMAVVQVVDMITMADCKMTTIGSVLVAVAGVPGTSAHCFLLSRRGGS